jgi:hypothetical protein
MNDEAKAPRQSGGVNIGGGSVTVGGDIVGRDKIVGTEVSTVQLEQIFRPLMESVRSAPPAVQLQAAEKVEELKKEAAKGKSATDNVMAKLVDGIVGLVPGAVSALAELSQLETIFGIFAIMFVGKSCVSIFEL